MIGIVSELCMASVGGSGLVPPTVAINLCPSCRVTQWVIIWTKLRFIRFPALSGSSRALSLLLGVTSAIFNCGCQCHQLGICWIRAQIMFQGSDMDSNSVYQFRWLLLVTKFLLASYACLVILTSRKCFFFEKVRKWFCMRVQALGYLALVCGHSLY